MNVCIYTSVNHANPTVCRYAEMTSGVKADYCERYGYSLILDDGPYDTGRVVRLLPLLDLYDMVWTLDADCLVTNMTIPIHSLPCLGPDVTACEEQIVPWNQINCGSVVWRNTSATRRILALIGAGREQWEALPCGWQTWLAADQDLTIAPSRAFNSCEWTSPGNGPGAAGSHWSPGDFVYHPCGVFPLEDRVERIRSKLTEIVS